MSALVIKSWRAETQPIDQQNNFVRITGREGGFFAWILALMRIDPVTTILVGLDRIEFSAASLAGSESRFILLDGISSTYFGYHKPWKAAASIIALFMFFGFSMHSFFWVPAIGIIIALAYYFLNRTLTLGFVESSGVVNGIRFNRSVIENVDINEEQAKKVCVMVQNLIQAKRKRP